VFLSVKMSDDSTENKQVFEGDKYAEDYRKGRPKHPESLINAVLHFLRLKYKDELDLAVDIGCGPGESTEILQPHFRRILGLDYSQSMIENAKKHNLFSNVEYFISSAESMPMIEDNSVVLVTAGRAIQYFDFEKFFQDCNRILKPGGIVAFYSSDHARFVIPEDPVKAGKLNERFRKLREVDTKGFWEGQIGIKQRKYVDIKVPFDDTLEIRDDSITNQSQTTLADFLQLFKSVPAFVKFSQVNGQETWNTLELNFINDFLDILQLPRNSDLSAIVLQTCHDYFVVMGRKD